MVASGFPAGDRDERAAAPPNRTVDGIRIDPILPNVNG
jgi:hypothetical protein